MNSMLKKYLPYAAIIFVIYIFVPFIFYIPALNRFSAVAYYFIFLVTQVVLSAIYCSKHGLDFLFALIAPIIFIPSMMIHNGGFSRIENILLVIIYLVAGIFGLFLGDLAFGEERRKREKKEQEAAEEVLLQAKRRDEEERERMTAQTAARQRTDYTRRSNTRRPASQSNQATSDNDDDFDYDKYTADIDKDLEARVNRLLDDE